MMSREKDQDIAQYLFGWTNFSTVDGELYGVEPNGKESIVPRYSSNIVDAEKILEKVSRYQIIKKGGRLTTVMLWVGGGTAYSGRGFDITEAITSCLMIWINRKIKDCRDGSCTNPEHNH
ncbi:hypothetical protein SP15_179 [Bacillus phage SP-15]|uniref:Uncharacterized protein n=1 Tax=Bacillus phage SP-15 TaxID=1792032 RepID=A0A127AWL6_9CAUD|nr:hypothetical protein SP15_179 [Bacillus phage SP-15]AMM44977.1 hypothetical protein SP15_179 [Bacillus phage SP-15]